MIENVPGIYNAPSIYKAGGGGGGGGDVIFYEVIGGKNYPCVKIGNKIFACENLDFLNSNIAFNPGGEVSTPAAWYYGGGNAPISDGDGLLYNWYAVKYIEDNKNNLLGNGWRILSRSDRSYFVDRLNSSSNGNSIKAKDGWQNGYEGIDLLYLQYKSNGRRAVNGNFDSRLFWGDFWLSDEYDVNMGYDFIIPGNSSTLNNPGGSDKRLAFSVRCCRDV